MKAAGPFFAGARIRQYLRLHDRAHEDGTLHTIAINGEEGSLRASDLRALLAVMDGYRQLGTKPLRVVLRALGEYRDYVQILEDDGDFGNEPFSLVEVEATIEAVAAYCGEEVPSRGDMFA